MKTLEKALQDTFDDRILSKNEKYAFIDLLQDYKDDVDALNFTRNQAFKLIKTLHNQSGSFDADAFKWLEHIIKAIDTVRSPEISTTKNTAYFSPGNDCRNKIISEIRRAKTNIDVCVFTISDNQISDALLKAHQNKIAVRIISDNDKSNDLGSDIDHLKSHGIPVVMDNSSNHMHHKFAIFDGSTLISGSFNWTRSATEHNEENISLLHDHRLLKAFKHTFERLWKKFSD